MDTENQNAAEIELRHNEVDAILNDPPAWIVRVGSYMIYGLVLMIITIAAIIKYPDTITSEIELKASGKTSIMLPYSNLARQIKQNENVNIELDNYPAKDFGFLTAKVGNIEYSAINQNYEITLLLPQKIELKNHKTLSITNTIKGKATIILNNKSLLQRILNTLLKKY